VERAGGEVRGIACLIELDFLEGRKKLTDYALHTFLHY
jgi:adenine/guanine phosphoribosyltransferase-like PRPP-binding protein